MSRSLAAIRSAYIWQKRAQLGSKVLVRVLDTLLQVDRDRVRLDTSSGHDSIEIVEAVCTVNGQDFDMTDVLDDMWAYGDGRRIDVPIYVALTSVGCENDQDKNTAVTTRIRYRGHSNISKRYGSQTFSARYSCKSSETLRFPPYAASESIRRGLGVPRILRCNFVDENGSMLYGPEARESSGLRRNFYDDVDDDPCLQKNAVTFFDLSSRFRERKQLVITTSKANSKILCNS